MRERLINRSRQGDLGEASAIEWLTSKGALVWIPLGHSPDVDLVAEVEGRLLRVQVKTTTQRETTPDGHERWSASVATNGGNQSWTRVAKRFDSRCVDFLFVLVGDGRRWFIPADAVESTVGLKLAGTKYSEFEIEATNPILEAVYGPDSTRSRIHGPDRGSAGVGEPGRSVKSVATHEWVRFPPPPSLSAPPRGGKPSHERKLGRAGQAIVRGKRQMTLPAKPYTEAGLSVGDRVRFRADGPGRIILERIVQPPNRLASNDCDPTLFG